MKLRLLSLYDMVTDSFWFLPLVMALLAGIAAMGSVAIDHALGSGWVKEMGWVWSGGADGARSVLSVISGSVMTVVSIVFSITVTTLAQTSSHFGPRVLRNFTSDRGVQFTLGTFISTFVFCLLVLRTVRSVEERIFVPYLSVNIGVFLALASLAVLIYFIDHVSQSIQAENLIAKVGEDFQASIARLFPEQIGHPETSGKTGEQMPEEAQWEVASRVESGAMGYLQRVDDEGLMRLATQHDLVLKLEKRPGDFIGSSSTLVRSWPPSHTDAAITRQISGCFSVGPHRTPHQDALYSMQQLVEIAAHALSPGINEPFTAITCIDWIGASLASVAKRELPELMRQDEDGRCRVIASPLTFAEMASAAFDQIRIYGTDNPDIALCLLKTIAKISPDLSRDQDREVLMAHAQLIGADASQIQNEDDRKRVSNQLQQTLQSLSTKS